MKTPPGLAPRGVAPENLPQQIAEGRSNARRKRGYR
jgi:hypothetical protein